MKLYYDLHIHSALSPCADDDMTPNNIVNMAAIKGLDVIAVTDHNSTSNSVAAISAAKNASLDLIVLPGIEAETAEEIHVICLFSGITAALEMEKFIAERLPAVKNREDIYGKQVRYDEFDNIIGYNENLLSTAVNVGFSELIEKVRSLGGAAIPAHVDKEAYSVLSSLGFIPMEDEISVVEISKNTDPQKFMNEKSRLLGGAKSFLVSSDSHYLENISEREYYLEIDGEPTAENIVRHISGGAKEALIGYTEVLAVKRRYLNG